MNLPLGYLLCPVCNTARKAGDPCRCNPRLDHVPNFDAETVCCACGKPKSKHFESKFGLRCYAVGDEVFREAVREPSKYQAVQEKELQRDIAAYLRLHGIWFDQDAINKRRRGTKGACDFQFAYRGVPIGCEAKTDKGKLSPDQERAHEQMRANGWRIIVARSVADLQALFRAIDAEQ